MSNDEKLMIDWNKMEHLNIEAYTDMLRVEMHSLVDEWSKIYTTVYLKQYNSLYLY